MHLLVVVLRSNQTVVFANVKRMRCLMSTETWSLNLNIKRRYRAKQHFSISFTFSVTLIQSKLLHDILTEKLEYRSEQLVKTALSTCSC